MIGVNLQAREVFPEAGHRLKDVAAMMVEACMKDMEN